MKTTSLVLVFVFLSLPSLIFAQDTVVLSNGDDIVGEIKGMDKSVLTIETDYSSSDFEIEWENVVDLTSASVYIINLKDGSKIDGTINIKAKSATIKDEKTGESKTVALNEVVYLNSVSQGFWDKMSISIDGGYTHSKAGNNNQFTLRGNASYLSTRINPDIYFNFVQSAIDANDSVRAESKRNNYGGNFRIFFAKSWFGIFGADYLTSDELGLDLRSTYTLGLGYYPIKSNKMYLNVSAGAAINNEQLMDTSLGDNNTSTEGYLSAEYNAFNLNDISIVSDIKYYPGLSEQGRHRVNYKLDVKLDLPRDFYIGFGYTINYDNMPSSEGVDDSDYVIQTTIGWSL
ncbi:DUF481 domain-containing protein [Reichenbachiella ulvae]|uniref:DUF481 domain-containing protein n=1 Tax=Reichenbachiella ulvae TaxID=2980104 RepID=A0ABT3CQ05_9BACT|nr:DUF481 domain-containing protein [Reichenbachiella ulvae]MCV9385811.1 DUF481 domain-containing protein [Reichenbachiella ulvae]